MDEQSSSLNLLIFSLQSFDADVHPRDGDVCVCGADASDGDDDDGACAYDAVPKMSESSRQPSLHFRHSICENEKSIETYGLQLHQIVCKSE